MILSKKLFNNKFIKYVFFSIITSCINVGTYILCYNFVFKSVIISNIIAYSLSIIISFNINKKMVFKDKSQKFLCQLFIYILIKLMALTIDSIVLITLHKFLKIDNFFAKLIANSSTTISNYLLNKKLIFKNKDK